MRKKLIFFWSVVSFLFFVFVLFLRSLSSVLARQTSEKGLMLWYLNAQTPLCSCLLQVHQSLKSLQGYDASKECPPAKWQSGSSATCWQFEAVVSWLAVSASFASMHKSVTVIFCTSPILKRVWERERVYVWVNCKVCGVCMFMCGDEHMGVLLRLA